MADDLSSRSDIESRSQQSLNNNEDDSDPDDGPADIRTEAQSVSHMFEDEVEEKYKMLMLSNV